MQKDNYLLFPAACRMIILFMICHLLFSCLRHDRTLNVSGDERNNVRERISINEDWLFFKYDGRPDELIYDVRPRLTGFRDDAPADSMPGEGYNAGSSIEVLKPWILPAGNRFIRDSSKHYVRPEGNPGEEFPFVSKNFDDSRWIKVSLPHDWAVAGPFIEGRDASVGGGMGRLPSPGVAWYRKKIDIPESDSARSVFLDVDGAMSYAMVWVNGKIAGGWPYGYASWRLDITPYIIPGTVNQIAIRLDNPPASSRWYPGAGIYRNVWLVKTNQVHVGQWGTFITTSEVNRKSAKVDIAVTIDNDTESDAVVKVVTEIFFLDMNNYKKGKAVAATPPAIINIKAGTSTETKSFAVIRDPALWGPPPSQHPNRYLAVTTIWQNDKITDRYETPFGIRSLRFDPDSGVFVNNQPIKIRGVNMHHDLGPLGSAFNIRAAERQLEMLREMGCNAVRTAHNPPAPELLELTDRMGFLVMDEAFDVWERGKTPLDFHLIFPDWHEQDLRAMIRRDRNSPSVIIWSIGNEVGEQYTGEEGASLAKRLRDIVREEDTTRPVTAAMNFAKPGMPFPAVLDLISLNYQGEGIRFTPEFEGTNRIRTAPQYMNFHQTYPDKVILSSETASAFSSRGVYLFPVAAGNSDIVRDGRGGDSEIRHVSSYELYAVDFGSSADKVFGSLDHHPFVAGEFVWTGWDHLGEPTPYYDSRSSYCGIIDLAGFRKDRYYLYRSHWRPEIPLVHILPHWNWPERNGEITPVHVFTSGDEAELFLNGKSLGRKKKESFEYRLRWDEVRYEPGVLKAVAYKDGRKWAEDIVETTGEPTSLKASSDRKIIIADGTDLAFITVEVTDNLKRVVPRTSNLIEFSIEGPGIIIATDNGDQTDMTPFPSSNRKAFNGMALAVVRSVKGVKGMVKVTVKSEGLRGDLIRIKCE